MSKISDEVLKTIEREKITPKPRWEFLFKNYIIWIFFAIFIISGALAVSTILFILTTQDWDVYDYLGRGFLAHVFISIPHFWIIIFVLLILIAYYDFVHTKYGYRYAVSRIFLLSIVGGLILGIALFFCGIDSQIHTNLSKNVPFYNGLIYYKEDIWDKPERGLLSGEIIDMKNKNEFILKDFQGNTWDVTGDNILWPDDLIPRKGLEIKIIGQKQIDSNFYCKTIRRW